MKSQKKGHLRRDSWSPFTRIVHVSFEVGILIKGFDGLLEIVGGLLLSFVSPQQISHVVTLFTQHELSKDPNDWVAGHVLSLAGEFMGAKAFTVFFLLSHGVLKVGLVWALLRSKLWAYPVAMWIFAAFGVYQMYRFVLSPSVLMVVLTILDAIIICLTWAEYQRLKRKM